MSRRSLKEIEAFAHKILVTYFCDSDMEFMISTFADDIIWLGGGEKQKAEGREAVTEHFRSGKDSMIACDMSEEEYHCMDLGGGSYLCEGVSHLRNKPGSEAYLDVVQRITFVFREKGDSLETVHIHNSVPYSAIGDDELFPVTAGKEELERLKTALNMRNIEYEHQAQFLEQLYNTVPCGIIHFSTDSSHEVITVNPMTWKFYGYTSEEEYRRDVKSPLQEVESQDYEWILSTIESLELNGKTASYNRHCIKKNGEEAWINAVMGRIVNSNGQEVIQAVFTDITEQMRLEMSQEQERILENRFLRAAIYRAYPLIMSINLTRDIYNFFVNNQSVYKMTQLDSFSGLMEDCAKDVYPSYQEDFITSFNRDEILRRFKNDEREIYMEMQAKGVDGEYHWVSIHIISVENPFDDNMLAIGLMKILDEQRMEQARQERLLRDALAAAKAANRAKSNFLSRMSHDIRTPMNAVIGMSAIGQLNIEDKERVGDCFRKIDVSSKYLLSLINDILDMSRIETDKMEIVHELFEFKGFVNEVNEIINPQAAEKGIVYSMQCQEDLDNAYIGDSLRMKQILINLLSNALKFTPSGGSINVEVQEESRSNGFARLRFVVKDTGIGIAEKFMNKVFQPFEQEEPGKARNNVGSGLGLSIVYNLVQLMGGTIDVKSKKHQGTVFTVVIPFQLASEEEKEEQEELEQDIRKNEEALNGLHILLAEDNELNQEIAKTLLEMQKAEVDVAENGEKAVEIFSKSKPGEYQVILMDIRMPVMDGIEATRKIRAMTRTDAKTIPILAMTANAFEEDKKEAFEADMTGYLVKPLNINALISELEKLL